MREPTGNRNRMNYIEDGQVPGTLGGNVQRTIEKATELENGDQADQLIREAEQAKAKMFQTPGRNAQVIDLENNFVHSAMVDESYLVLATHIDENLRNKIEKGEYVDLAKLLPKDRIAQEEDQRLQMVMKNGQTYWVPVNNSVAINNFTRWELAFRVYSDIYSRANPTRSAELIQYNHVIHTISTQFIWENVYDYDKDFRIHMSKYPLRNWSIILQQAWSM